MCSTCHPVRDEVHANGLQVLRDWAANCRAYGSIPIAVETSYTGRLVPVVETDSSAPLTDISFVLKPDPVWIRQASPPLRTRTFTTTS